MKVLLIGSEQTSDDLAQYYGQYVDFFKKGAGFSKTNIEIQWTLFDDLYVQVGDGEFVIVDTKSGQDVKDFDAVFIRGKNFRQFFDVVRAISRYTSVHKIPVINDYSGFRDSSKLAQAVQFHENELPVASTVYVNRAITEKGHPLPFDFPCIMKAVFGAHGNDNYLVNSLDEVRDIASKSSTRFVLQRFVSNDNDFRILVIGDEVLVISRKAVEGSHLNNTSKGGSAYLVPIESLPEDMINNAKKITSNLDMTVAGVDVLIENGTGDFFFLEVNSQPQLMTGAFVDEKAQMLGRFFDNLANNR